MGFGCFQARRKSPHLAILPRLPPRTIPTMLPILTSINTCTWVDGRREKREGFPSMRYVNMEIRKWGEILPLGYINMGIRKGELFRAPLILCPYVYGSGVLWMTRSLWASWTILMHLSISSYSSILSNGFCTSEHTCITSLRNLSNLFLSISHSPFLLTHVNVFDAKYHIPKWTCLIHLLLCSSNLNFFFLCLFRLPRFRRLFGFRLIGIQLLIQTCIFFGLHIFRDFLIRERYATIKNGTFVPGQVC